MNWFGRSAPAESAKPLPPNDASDAAPIPLPAMSIEREQAIAAAVASGRARGVRHALFLHAAGDLALPI
jgi:hypothetical protein